MDLRNETRTAPCVDCGTAVTYQAMLLYGKELFAGRRCPACDAAMIARHEARIARDRRDVIEARWAALCPPLYRDTDPAQLTAVKLAKVLAWEYGPKGLVIHGPTRRGKTRAMWLLVRKLIEREIRVIACDHVAFATECSAAFADGRGEAWSRRMSEVPVLFIDDFGKCKFTDRVEEVLWAIVESRIAHRRPLLLTTNYVGNKLVSRLSTDRGSSLVDRLREFCHSVSF